MDSLCRLAFRTLRGVGDAQLGEWEERGNIAYHVRRRLSLSEQCIVGPALDIRGTPEALARWQKVRLYLPEHHPMNAPL